MAEFFTEVVRQFGLPVGLLLVAVVILARIVVVQYRETRAAHAKQIEELEVERDFYRDKWIEAIGTAEVGTETAARLASGGRRKPGGTR